MKRIYFTLVLLAIATAGFSQTSYYVNDASQTGDVFTTALGDDTNPGTAAEPFLTLQAANIAAQPGDIIYVDAGNYLLASELLISKPITLLGSNYLISPNNSVNKPEYNINRNAETIVTGARLALAADGIIIKGFRFSPNGSAMGTVNNTNLKNIVLEKNSFDVVTGGGTTVVLSATAFNPTTAVNYTITDNRFDRSNLSTVPMLDINGLKDVLIDNNVFQSVGTTNGTAIRTSFGRIVENINITNNYIKKGNNGIQTFILKNAMIRNNVFDSCSQGFFMTPNTHPGPLGSSDITITQNLFKDLRLGRSVLFSSGEYGLSNLTISNNTINQSVNGINGVVSLIQLQYINTSATQIITNSTFGTTQVLNNVINISGDYLQNTVGSNNAIQLTGNHSNTTIAGNELNFTAINATSPAIAGIFPPVPTGIYIRTDGNVGYGTIPATAVININNNKISGFKSSIGIYDPTAAGTTANVGYGFLTTGATVNINNNSMTGDSMSIDNGIVSQSVNASCNWYGSALTATVSSKISSTVIQSPWLTEGSDNSTAIGFQTSATCPVANSFYVNDNSQSGDVFTTAIGDNVNPGTSAAPYATLDYAILQVPVGATIFVDAGYYQTSTDITLNKSITLLGTNYQISPNNPSTPLQLNTARLTESVVVNHKFIIAANDIRIKGFYFDPASKTQIQQTVTTNDFNNIEIEKNIFSSTSNVTVINLTGKQVSPLVTTNYTITDNRFEKDFGTAGTNININAIDAVQINNNVFTTNNTIANNARIQIGILIGNLTGDIVISNNNAYQQNFFINGQSAKKTTITFNTADDCNRFIFAVSGNVNPNELEITDNIITNPRSTGGPVISYVRNNGTNLSSPNIARFERNTIILNGTGLTSVAQALIAPTLDAASANTQVFIRNNKLSSTGDFSSLSSPTATVGGIRFLTNSRQAVVERNEIEFNATNYNPDNKFGIFISHSGLQPGTNFDFLNNKISGFTNSVAFIGSTGFGGLPAGVTANINNNSFTGDVMSINNGTVSQSVNASCNWYGSASVQNFFNKITIPTVDFVPWLTNGTDNEPLSTGFQPVPGTCDGYPTLITLDNYTDVTCNGAANGSTNITASYGRAPFTYTWTKDGDANFVSHDEDLTNLSPGTYHLALVDGNGSNIYITDPEADGPGTITVTITEPSILTASSSGGNVSCYGGNNGSATVTAVGGTAPYNYLWSNNETTSEITNLAAGTYSVTVTDDNGCTTTASYEVTQPAFLTADITNNSTACSNNATVTAGGGTAPYTYLWSNNGSTSSSITGVIAGIYSVTVTDANGCTATASVTLTVSGAFNPTASATDVTCFGANNGMITVTNANGTAPFTFSIDGINFLPGAFPYSFTNLAPGTYTVAARDVNGCTGFVTRTVLQPAQLVVTLTTVQSTCFGLNTGSVSVTALGGTGALSYSWTSDGGFTSTQKNISGLATGNYSLTVTDKNGCTSILNVFVPSLTQITINSTVNNIACKGELNGSIVLNVTGGTGNFSYLWNIGATASSISNLSTGNYSVTITDIGSGCVASKSFTITQPSNVVALSTSKTNGTGCASLGTITATGSGGTSPYQYSLDGINYLPSGSFTGLYAGSYTVRVKDANGCIKTSAAISITDNGLDEYDGSGSNKNNTKSKAASISTGVTIAGRIATTGDPEDWYKFTVTAAGNYILSLTHPSASFTYNLFTLNNATAIGTVGSTSTSKTYSLTAGDYYIQVTGGLSYVCYQLSVNATGFLTKSNVSIPQQEIVKANEKSGLFDVKVFGNPSSTGFIMNIITSTAEMMSMRVLDAQGRLIEQRQSLQPFETLRFGERYINGVYMAEIRQGKNIKTIRLVKM